MKHVVIGGGNLGLDIMKYGLSQTEDDFKLYTASNGFKYPCSIDPILDERPDHIWVTIGAGSVEGAIKDFKAYSDLHIRLVMELAQASSSFTLHVFSSDYVVEPMKSLYAYSKFAMENFLSILDRPKTNIYRVGTLYGTHKPHLTFPMKLLKNNPKPCKVTLPENLVVPTPTDWLAERLLMYNDKTGHMLNNTVNVFPMGSVAVFNWAEMILGPDYDIFTSGYDTKRPTKDPNLCPGLKLKTENWEDLWNERKGSYHAK